MKLSVDQEFFSENYIEDPKSVFEALKKSLTFGTDFTLNINEGALQEADRSSFNRWFQVSELRPSYAPLVQRDTERGFTWIQGKVFSVENSYGEGGDYLHIGIILRRNGVASREASLTFCMDYSGEVTLSTSDLYKRKDSATDEGSDVIISQEFIHLIRISNYSDQDCVLQMEIDDLLKVTSKEYPRLRFFEYKRKYSKSGLGEFVLSLRKDFQHTYDLEESEMAGVTAEVIMLRNLILHLKVLHKDFQFFVWLFVIFMSLVLYSVW